MNGAALVQTPVTLTRMRWTRKQIMEDEYLSNTTWYIPLPPEDGLQFFREEKSADAVFDVFFKKVQYAARVQTFPRSQKSTTLILETADDCDTEGLQWRLQEIHVIKAGTIQKIVECITEKDGEMNCPHVNVVLDTYRSFTTAEELLEKVIERYRIVSADSTIKETVKETTLKTLRTFLGVWLNAHPYDFNTPPFKLLLKLQEFCKITLGNQMDLTTRVQGRLERCLHQESGDSLSMDSSSSDFEEDSRSRRGFPRTVSFHGLSHPLRFEDIPNEVFAKQITSEDARLFKAVIRHQCLPCNWSKRTKTADNPSSTVSATVEHFNLVAMAVYSTVLNDPKLSSKLRGKRIEKWIEIASELRILKNFSSTLAVISGLKVESVYRLKSVWKHVSKESKQVFDELNSVFSTDSREITFKYLIQKEGTAKGIDANSIGISQRIKNNTKRRIDDPDSAYGSVPFFGSFLRDFIHLSESMEDYVEGGLINFEKRRREAEMLAQIKLMQVSAGNYNFERDPVFHEWFYQHIRRYSDKESFQMSLEIDPIKHKRSKSRAIFTSRQLSKASSLNSSNPSLFRTLENGTVNGNGSTLSTPVATLNRSISVGNLAESDGTIVAKVILDSRIMDKTVFYKSIRIYNDDRIRTVLERIFDKFSRPDLMEKVEKFCLSQVLDNGGEYDFVDTNEIKTNVFYAINANQAEVKLVVRRHADVKHSRNDPRYRKRNRRKYFPTYFH
ncbi:DgyrCDS3024 [Dimorphilus gyrociliatus]|uniref:DgyrCDS3024 n=1 Tax=Dimorphilus gyrociliatus TaxID=2664684 RepID=A0A7I8VH18_9ANNE|nr:DgyrCDS3024 [Dimorphilus gyrociliatus]